MYIEAIIFKREKESKLEKGFYIGKHDNCKESMILDKNYNPVEGDKDGYRVWNYYGDLNNRICLNIPSFEEEN